VTLSKVQNTFWIPFVIVGGRLLIPQMKLEEKICFWIKYNKNPFPSITNVPEFTLPYL
jgi:hypothetical protein